MPDFSGLTYDEVENKLVKYLIEFVYRATRENAMPEDKAVLADVATILARILAKGFI